MVSQKHVEIAMEAIGNPFTTQDIETYLFDNKLHDRVKWDIKTEISAVLQTFRKWKMVDRLPQCHTHNRKTIWYMTKLGIDHNEKTCKICHDIRKSHNMYYSDMIQKNIYNRTKLFREDNGEDDNFIYRRGGY